MSEQDLESPIVTVVWSFIKDERRKYYCPRHLHTINREHVMKDLMENDETYCEVCGVVLVWKQSEDGIWEFWEKTIDYEVRN